MGKTVTILVLKQNEERTQCTYIYIQVCQPAASQEKQTADMTSLCKR